jgi:hypothetical protein
LAAAEVETARRAHGEVLAKHFAKHQAALDYLAELVREANAAARTIARAINAAEKDGLVPMLWLRRARRAHTLLREAAEALSR